MHQKQKKVCSKMFIYNFSSVIKKKDEPLHGAYYNHTKIAKKEEYFLGEIHLKTLKEYDDKLLFICIETMLGLIYTL